MPLQRVGTDPVPRLAQLRATDPVHRLKFPFDFRVHLVTGHDQVRAVLADRDGYSNDIRHLLPGTGPAAAERRRRAGVHRPAGAHPAAQDRHAGVHDAPAGPAASR